MASPDSRVTWESRATGESWDPPGPGEKTAQRDPRDAPVCLEMQVRSALAVRRVNWAFLVSQVTPVDKDQRARRASKDSLEPTERRELGELLESLAHEDREDQQARGASEDHEDLQGKQDPRATLEATALQDLSARGVCPDLKDQPVSQDQRAHLDPPERTACPDTPDREAKLVSKAKRDPLDLLVLWDLRGRQVRLDPWEIVATQDLQAPPESKVYLVPRARKEPRVIPALPDPLVRTVLLDSEASPEREVSPAPRALTA